ncbi:GNAT family N-acetyltransferase [Paracoccaceae bacterium GXU_MW_L88]
MQKLAESFGRYHLRQAQRAEDLIACQALRGRAFRGGALDADDFDSLCDHIMVETGEGQLVACFRMLPFSSGAEIGKSYSARYYELSALHGYTQPMVEMGRFCVDPDWRDPDILRAAWAGMTRYVDQNGVRMLFGCASFHGTDEQDYLDAFALLRARHLGPKRWLPRVKAPRVFRFAKVLARMRPDLKRAQKHMPPLLRSYLVMGGWVSDHAVIDHDLGTLHVFTGLEIDRIPPARARLMRQSAV